MKRARELGPNNQDYYYFVQAASSVKGGQNCLYPGRGPFSTEPHSGANLTPVCVYQEDQDGDVERDTGCVAVEVADGTQDTGCVQTTQLLDGDTKLYLQPNVEACIAQMKEVSTN